MSSDRMAPDTPHRGSTPIRQFILKIASRCNLSCTYCFMYRSHDQSWQHMPRMMSDATVDAVADRIGEHAELHDLRDVELILHGGEPLLAGREYIRRMVSRIQARLSPELRTRWGVQTNGVLLDDAWLEIFAELDVRVCVSIDGDTSHHDRHRVDGRGRGTYSRVSQGLRLLGQPQFARIYAGLLAVVDLRNDPVDVYESLLEFAPPRLDFLLPHGNWSSPPPGLPGGAATPYGDWLSAAFDRWFHAERQETVVRLFQDTVVLLLGGPATSTHLGLSPVGFVVVNTDGAFEQVDSLRTAAAGEVRTGLNVLTDSVDAVVAHPAVQRRQMGENGLAEECRRCRLVSSCGGGNYAHRYRHGTGFLNRSVYCPDLQRYIDHVRAAVHASVA